MERFGLKAHREVRTIPIYLLIQAKGGAKLKLGLSQSPDGQRPSESALMFIPIGSTFRLYGKSVGIAKLASNLARNLQRPVIDQTGMLGLYEVDLRFRPDSAASTPDGGMADDQLAASLFTAIKEQLGLELKDTKGPVEMLVIDRIEREPKTN